MRQADSRAWVEIMVETTPAAAETVAELLLEVGCGGVVYQDPRLYDATKDQPAELQPSILSASNSSFRVGGYLPLFDGWKEIVDWLQAEVDKLRAFLPVGTGEITLRRRQEEDWATAWKAYYQPERVGKFVVTPSWLPPVVQPGEMLITLDPGMAFGTGNHPTTKLCLELMPDLIREGMLVYDVGTGSGILAIAAAKLGARVIAVDLDPVATEVAAENIARNQVEDQVTVRTANLLEGLWQPADLIIANIIADVIIELLPVAHTRLKPGGALLASGIIDHKAAKVKAACTAAGFTIQKSRASEDWRAYLAIWDGEKNA
ncbi:MAG: 50S ribosomal protein L11 methyltransferase [Firmicutes bacterium]|nr:50S ribosomal protein L11 methyltransferase [Bacillota bacterium]